jgi:alpha-glucosidase (family GH31 glycosyl hydrolase)
VRTGWFNQTSPILFRLWDLWSIWTHANGLRAVIPATLSLSLTGYPFTFPDMIGGNGYFTFPANRFLNFLIARIIIPIMERSKRSSVKDEDVAIHASDVPGIIQKMPVFGWPTAELMIRWTQLNALMPVMQFSIKPWELGKRCAEICRQYAHLHLKFTPLFEQLARGVTITGKPVIRPVFWLAPHDHRALVCDDQFLVGDKLLVAPVVHEAKRDRAIYLPPGTWRDYWSGEMFEGPAVLEKYPAPLDILPIFAGQGEQF